MRSPGEIKTELLRLRFTNKLSVAELGRRSRCSPGHIGSALKLEASETILRRLDAFLDAKDLHKTAKTSSLISSIEKMRIEIYKIYKERSIPMHDVMRKSPTEQQRLYRAMNFRLKRLLRAKIIEEYGFEPIIPDSYSYWKAKAKVVARVGELAPNREPDSGHGKGPVVQNRPLHSNRM